MAIEILMSGNEKQKLQAMKILQDEDNLMIKRNQLVGNLPSEAPTIAIQNNNVMDGATTLADSIRRIHPELIEKFSYNKAKIKKGDDKDVISNN